MQKNTVSLKNLMQQRLIDLSLKVVSIISVKSSWYQTTSRKSDVTKAGPFAKNSSMFKYINQVLNTKSGMNNHAHYSYAIEEVARVTRGLALCACS